MRAIIWKEFRENFKWAVLCLLGMSVTMALLLYAYHRIGNPLLSDEFQMLILCGSAGFAVLLGLLQTIPELRRDRWAFLLHRPMTPTRLFLAKATAGLLLYSMTVLVPLLAASAWVAQPGHFPAPFEWRMILPGIADIAGGVAYYFAAMLIGRRQARWYGSRVLPAALAILCSMAIFTVPEFWQALLTALAGTAILGTAAWGSFIASGQYGPQPAPAKAALGLSVWSGITLLGVIGATMTWTMIEVRKPLKAWTQYRIDSTGHAVLLTMEPSVEIITSVTDLAGNPVDRYKGKCYYELSPQEFVRPTTVRSDNLAPCGKGYRNERRFFNARLTDGSAYWFYVYSRRLIVGYDIRTRQFVGTLSPAGFGPVGTPVQGAFPNEPLLAASGWLGSTMAFPSVAYQVDYRNRQIQVLMHGDRERPILAANCLSTDGQRAGWPACVVTSEGIYIFSSATQPPVRLDSPLRTVDYANISVGNLPNGGYVVEYCTSWFPEYDVPQHTQVIVFSATGAATERYEMPTLHKPMYTPYSLAAVLASLTPIALVIGFVVFILVGAWAWHEPAVFYMMLRQFQYDLLGRHSQDAWLAGGLMLAGAVVWAIAIVWLGRRYAFSKRQLQWWAVGGLLLGPAGLLMLLAMREWPARVACPSCGRPRVVNREHCEHCGGIFPPPPATGSEIIEDYSAAIDADR